MATLTNSNAEDFGNVADGQVVVTHASLIADEGGTNQQLIWTGALTHSRTLEVGDPLELPAGELDVGLPAGAQGVQTGWLQDMMDVYFAAGARGVPTMKLGTAAMGAAGTNNEVSDSGYTEQEIELTIAA